MIPVDAALAAVLEATQRLPAEEAPLAEALGRVLAEPVRADMDMPPFDRAAMDGYALRAADVGVLPATLALAGRVRAGEMPGVGLPLGGAVSIMTGAPLPDGADAVLQVEKSRLLDGGRVELQGAVTPGLNVAPRGSEARRGDLLLEAGDPIDPASVAVLAAHGYARVRVGCRPRLALLVTGDELVDVARVPGPAQIRNSNGPAVHAQAVAAGARVKSLGIVPDDLERLADAVGRGLEADVLVASGGVSAGAFDLVEDAFARHGVAVAFERVAIKPGAPLVFGRRGRTLVFGLPGNPVSAQVTFELFVRPALLKLQGARRPSRPRVEVELLAPARNRSGRDYFLPARASFSGGRLLAEPLRSLGSADAAAHARANALVLLHAERREALAGERAPAVLLGNFLDREGI
ncbi:MAG: gephyrin-like molybdotransferase Glp [Vicinamibacteria bacterium]